MTIQQRSSNWTVGSSKDQPDKRRLINLTCHRRHPPAAQYTRILRIGPVWLETPGPLLPPSMRQTLWRFFRKPRKYAIDYLSRHIIPFLVSVDELTLLLDQHIFLKAPPSLISDTLWISLNPRLRKLNYRGTIEDLQQILSPTPRNSPPNLTHLVIYFYAHLQWSAIPIANIAVFVAFVQSLEQTLESLSLRIPTRPTSILLKLPHFPRLEHLNIHLDTYDISPEASVAFALFLSTHREYLKTLALCMYPELSHSTQIFRDFCNTSFPLLHTLMLDNTQDFVERTEAFPHVPSLQSFVSGGRNLSKETMIKIRERASPSQPTIVSRNRLVVEFGLLAGIVRIF